MKPFYALAALAGVAWCVHRFLIPLNEREKNRVQEKRLEVWEGEGGAVPAAAARKAVQVRPEKPSSASSSGDS